MEPPVSAGSVGDVAAYCWRLVKEQIQAVMPVCTFLALFQIVVIGQHIERGGDILAGLGWTILGLALFTFGLLNGLMPMGERLGRQLPLALSSPALLAVAGVLGVAVTLAEPALGVVKTAGSLIKPSEAPHLYILLHEQTDLLVLAVALGVGLSASAGMLRIRMNRDLKGPVLMLVLFTLMLSSVVHFKSEHGDILGLAWDLGAVTTGPVTVPLVIALGMGVAGAGANPSPLTGFGVCLVPPPHSRDQKLRAASPSPSHLLTLFLHLHARRACTHTRTCAHTRHLSSAAD